MKFKKSTAERFVAYFDIMGFKDFVNRNSHRTLKTRMSEVSKIISEIKNYNIKAKERRATILPAFFSDSILFVSESNTNNDATALIYTAEFFLAKMLRKKIPLKGALAYGLFTADFPNSKFFGAPLVDAVLLSDELHYYGAVLHHSFDDFLDQSVVGKMDLVPKNPVPIKSNGLVRHSHISISDYLKNIDVSTEQLLSPFYCSASGGVRRYIDNSINVYQN